MHGAWGPAVGQEQQGRARNNRAGLGRQSHTVVLLRLGEDWGMPGLAEDILSSWVGECLTQTPCSVIPRLHPDAPQSSDWAKNEGVEQGCS